jgi:hypothetical protein
MSEDSLNRLGVALLCLCAALAGLLELLLVPLYAGSALVPVAVLLAIASNIALPRMSRALIDRTGAAVLPFLSWLVVIGVIALVPRPEGDVILPAGSVGVQLVGYGVLLGGSMAGTITVVLSGATRSMGRPPAPPPGTTPPPPTARETDLSR